MVAYQIPFTTKNGRKADIFPASWIADMNNEAGSATIPLKDKTIDDELLKEMCDLMCKVNVKATEACLNTASDATVLHNSFAMERDVTTKQFEEMVENWIDEESDPLFINEMVMDEIDAIKNEARLEAYDKAEYDDSEDEDEVVVVTPMQPEQKQRVTHVEATGAVDVLRNYMTSLEMPEECFMTLARLQRQILQE